MNEIKMAATRDAYGKVLAELGREYPNVVVLDADLSASTKTAGFAKAFPERFFDMGVAEQDMIGTAAGLAASGKIVFASTFAVFGSGRAWDQVRVSVAYTRLNVKIVVTHAGITTGEDGASHQANEDIAIMRALPNMTVVVPADAVETERVIREAVKYYGPMYIRLSRPKTPILHNDPNYSFKIGKGEVMRAGSGLTIIACGLMVGPSLSAAAALEQEGINARGQSAYDQAARQGIAGQVRARDRRLGHGRGTFDFRRLGRRGGRGDRGERAGADGPGRFERRVRRIGHAR